MDLNLSLEQQMLKDSVAVYMRDYAALRPTSLTEPNGCQENIWSAIAELGWLAVGFDEDVGGFGFGAVGEMLVHEGIGGGLMIEPVLDATFAARALALAADPARRDALLPALLSGEQRAVFADEEPHGRAVSARVLPDGEGFALSGTKALAIGAPGADWLVLSATIDGESALFLAAAGLLRQRMRSCRTIDGQAAAEIRLDGIALPADSLIARGTRAQDAIEQARDHAVIGACAEAVGAMDAAIAITREHLNTRHQFGQPIGSFQALQHKLADMIIAAEQARSVLLFGVASLGAADPARRARGVSAARVLVIDSARLVGAHAVQMHGGIGVTEEHIISHYFRRFTTFARRLGSQDQHLARFAASADGEDI